MSAPSRAGFSLVEALVALAVTSLLLVLLFTVGVGARSAGFRTARRAVASADAQVGVRSVRLLLRSLRLPRRGGWDTPLSGDAAQLRATAAPQRSTVCPGVRPGSRLQLRIETAAGRRQLVCQTEGGRVTPVLDLGTGPAGFAYALAGRPWTDRIEARLPPLAPGASRPPSPRLWVRLAGSGFELIEAVDAPLLREPTAGAAAAS